MSFIRLFSRPKYLSGERLGSFQPKCALAESFASISAGLHCLKLVAAAASGKQLADDAGLARDRGEPLVEPFEAVREPQVIEAEQVQ